VLRRLRGLEPDDLALYPDETGARAALSRRFEIEAPLDLVLTSGVDEGSAGLRGVRRAGERVLILEPGYPLYRFYAALAGRAAGGRVRTGDRFPAESSSCARRGLPPVILGDPNNPTGTPLPPGLSRLSARGSRIVVLATKPTRSSRSRRRFRSCAAFRT